VWRGAWQCAVVGIRHNCENLVQEFEKSVKQDGCINLQREGEADWFV